MPNPKFRVAVCGGGVGGLITAYALGRSNDIEVDVYESASQFAEVGAGIGVGWRAWCILQSLGLDQALSKYIAAPPSDGMVPFIHAFKSDQEEPGVHVADATTRGGHATFLRSDFHGAILQHLSPRVRTFTSKRLVSYQEPDDISQPISLCFKDGSTATCDILVGADGIKSAVRGSMLEAMAKNAEDAGDSTKAQDMHGLIPAKFSGAIAYRTLIPAEKLSGMVSGHPCLSRPMFYLGKNLRIVTYPVAQGKIINFVLTEHDYSKEDTLFPEPWTMASIDPKPIISLFDHWEPDVRALVKCLEGCTISKWAINYVFGLPSFVTSRVALLGDAAHAMTPFQGVGAGQAAEDAYVLSALLSDSSTTRSTVRTALKIYSDNRLPFVYKVSEQSRLTGMLCTFYDLENPDQKSGEVDLQAHGERIKETLKWLKEAPSAEEEANMAVALLKQELA